MTPEQFASNFRQHLPLISRYLSRRVPEADVEDLAAATFEVAWAKRGTVTLGEELPWLYKIAGYQVANFRRKQATVSKYLTLTLVPDSAPSAESIAVADLDLANALKVLSAADRELLALVVLDGLAVNTAAEVLGISANAASSRLHRSRQKLAQKLSMQDSLE